MGLEVANKATIGQDFVSFTGREGARAATGEFFWKFDTLRVQFQVIGQITTRITDPKRSLDFYQRPASCCIALTAAPLSGAG